MMIPVRILCLGLALAASLAWPCAAHAERAERARDAHRPTELIVRYHDHATAQQVHQHAIGMGVEILEPGHPRRGRIGLTPLPPGRDPVRMARELEASTLVRYAEPNWVRIPHQVQEPNDPRFDDQYALHNTGVTTATGEPATAGADLDLVRAWSLETGNETIIIAVIDGPIDVGHEDLADNIMEGQCFGTTGCITTDPTNVSSGSNTNSHGTLVAGAAGAVGNNGEGIAGAAWTVRIMPLKTDLSIAAAAEAIDFAAENGAHIINASYGGAQRTNIEREAIERARDAGVLFVTSAGNFDSDNDKGQLSFPQTYDVSNIIAVAATNATDTLTEWSQYGQTSVRLAAPGEDILSTRPGDGYQFASGTSLASPLVAGIAALVRAKFDGISLDETIARLVAGADLPVALQGRVMGGRANAFNALQDELLVDKTVLVVDGIEVDDTAVPGNGNQQLDAGETANLVVRVASLWGDAGNVTGTLSIPDDAHRQFITIEQESAVSTETVTGPPEPEADQATGELAFRVSVPTGLLGNHRVLFRLVLQDNFGGEPVTRWFWHELGLLEPGRTLQQAIRRDLQEEFHAYHFDVPPGATDLRITTETIDQIDIDLLARFDAPPQYLINLGTDPEGSGAFFQVGDGTLVSGRADGNEEIGNEDIGPEDPESGTWHIVVVNFDRIEHAYRVNVGWCEDGVCPARVRFQQASFTAPGDVTSVDIPVVREDGSEGPVSVAFSTVDGGSASPGNDYTPVDGTLTWDEGETGVKTFSIPINPDRTTNFARTIHVRLDDAVGALLAVPSMQAVMTVAAPPAPPADDDPDPPPRRSGGGALDAVWLTLFAILLFALSWRRRLEGH